MFCIGKLIQPSRKKKKPKSPHSITRALAANGAAEKKPYSDSEVRFSQKNMQ